MYRFILRPLLWLAFRTIALWNPKARRGLAGRRRWREDLAALRQRSDGGEMRLHIHAASVGEFEQAKPIIEELRRRRGDGRTIVTVSFYSPSGYEQQKDYPGVDAVSYLPEDRAAEMDPFFARLDPDLLIVVRYDLWPGMISAARRRGLPVILIAAVLREDSTRFNPLLRSHFRNLYGGLRLVCAVAVEDAAQFHRLVPELPVVVTGDSRYDRVAARAKQSVALPPPLAGLAERGDVIVAGSTWPADEALLLEVARRPDTTLVIVPHEPNPRALADLLRRFPGGYPLSKLTETPIDLTGRPIIVDRTGILSALYRIGTLAYVGGGFGDGVHSVLEPAAYSLPVFAAPRIERSADAVAMRTVGALRTTADAGELRRMIDELLGNREALKQRGELAARFVAERCGATARTVDAVMELLGG